MINLNDSEILTSPQAVDSMINIMKDMWYLRMETDNFLMLVNKSSGEYVNLYAYGNPVCQSILKKMVLKLDKHPKMEI